MWGNSIGARVKKVIAHRVKQAQKEHNEECALLDQKCDEAIVELEQVRDENKEQHAEAMVERILGKIN